MIAVPASRVERFPYNVAALALGAAGIAAAGVTIWAVARSPVLVDPTQTAWLRGLYVASYAAVGAYSWWRRPDSRLGLLVAGAGFFTALASLIASGGSVQYTLGRVLLASFVVYLAYVFLCFPRDRLDSRIERQFIGALALTTVLAWALVLALADKLPAAGALADCGSRCPGNAFQLASTSQSLTDALDLLTNAVTAFALAVLTILLVRKVRSRSILRRRAIGPLVYCAIALTSSYAVFSLLREADVVGDTGVLRITTAASALAIPVAMLVGQIQGRVFAATSLGHLVASMSGESVTPAGVQNLVRNALGDPTLELVLWSPERVGYVDVTGAPAELPNDTFERAVTHVTREERPVAALVHDASLDESPGVVEGIIATALMLLENARLVDELSASRARIVSAADLARLRLERDLHDGAQQRLMSIQIRLAEARRYAEPPGLAKELEEIGEDAAAAVVELRLLAQGIYPTVLRERGLADGLRAVAEKASIVVRVQDEGVGRCPPTVEAAVYFCSAEAIQNAVKYAGPDARVTVSLARVENELQFGVVDDGLGFAPGEARAGVGLVSMRDRIGAVGGELEVISSPGRGTSVCGTVPLDAEQADRASG